MYISLNNLNSSTYISLHISIDVFYKDYRI